MRRSTALLLAALLAVPGTRLAGQGGGTVLLPQPENPTSRVGTRGANFLEIGIGARGLALAGAYTALAEGVTSLYWNPAGIGEMEGPAAAVSVQQLYGEDGLDHSFVGGVLPVGTNGAFGISLTQLTSGDIERTTEAFPDGGDPAFGATFSYSATAAGLYYGRRLTDRLAIGIGLKFVTEGIDNAKANYYGLDVGTKFRTGLYGVHIAASLANLGSSSRFQGAAIERFSIDEFRPGFTQVQFSTTGVQMPTLFRFSVRSDVFGASDAVLGANPMHNFVALAEFQDAIDTDVQLLMGAEYSYRELVFLRGGKRWVNEKETDFRSGSHGLAVGGGVRLPLGGSRRLSFDYAFTDMDELNNIHVFSIEFGF
ncbi:MAG: PorV/PorQ family protein [Gemmatimonadetes bacterium]|nr:PorV/PorQ family protein [Gemmatimonadota bacterium]